MKAETNTKTTTTVHLYLSEEEAHWLRSYLKIYARVPGEESAEHYETRKELYETLISALD